MKRSFKQLVGVFLLALLLIGSGTQKTFAQNEYVSYQTFYDQLAPYGQWVGDPQYGNVWVPYDQMGFRPYYTGGHWVMTDYGNTWVSDYPWGWACFHYGRWTYNSYYGWVWIPGYEWAPAWVSWRYGGGYCGWAPLGPGYAMGQPYYCPDNYWVFVEPTYIYHPHFQEYYRGPEYNTRYINQTTVINEVYVDNGSHVQYYYGPRASQIEQVTHQPVQVYRVGTSNTPGAYSQGGNTLNIYRPRVNQETINTARPANVIQASHPVGRPQSAEMNPNHEPAFKQEIQQHGGAQNNQQQGRGNNEPQQHNNPEPQQHNNPQPQQHNNPEPQQHNNPQPQQHNNPEPQQHNNPQPQQHNNPQPQQHNNPQPQQHNNPQPQQHNNPQPKKSSSAPKSEGHEKR